MLGPIVNAIAIIVTSLIGVLIAKIFGKGIPERVREIIMKALGLAVIYIGINGAIGSKEPLVLIFSLVIGAIIGEIINIDKGMKNFGLWTEKKLSSGKKSPTVAFGNEVSETSNFAKGFNSASIIFCSGSMAIVGAMESGLMNNHEMLFAKSVLDGFICIVFAYEMGIGVAFSAIPVFIYEGGIALAAIFAKDFIPMDVVIEMSAVGSLVIAGIGFNFLGVKEIKVANLIPAVFMPPLIMWVISLF
ncbi:MAG: DUF554 domain-containing protein [Anaerovoracaceae bacterium]